MYAVVSTGGKQYRVEAGSELVVERVPGDADQVTVGTPVVSGATVSATVLREELGPKLVIFKFKQKVKYRRRTGHRQHLVRVRIDAINADGSSKPRTEKAEAAEKPAKAAAKPRASRAKAASASASEAKADDKPKTTRKPRTTKAAKADEAGTAKE